MPTPDATPAAAGGDASFQQSWKGPSDRRADQSARNPSSLSPLTAQKSEHHHVTLPRK